MAPPARRSPRYRRRIFGVGLIATAALYGIGAPIYNGRIERDLERRVPKELADHGFTGIRAAFSGQDGTLTCATPLKNPQATLTAAYEIWGVRSIELDRSCRVNRAPSVGQTDGPTAGADDVSLSSTVNTGGTSESTFQSVGDVIGMDPQFGLFRTLVQEAGLQPMLSDPSGGPFTVFAPTDAAFATLTPDAIAELRANPEQLAAVVRHHIAAGRLLANDLVAGDLTMDDGSTVAIALDGSSVSIDGAQLTQPDIATSNGVVHAIDEVVLPPGVELGAIDAAGQLNASFESGTMTFDGVVASEVDRAILVSSATAAGLDPASVIDRLTVDSGSGLDGPTMASLAQLVEVIPANLISATTGFDGSSLYISGVYASDAGLAAVQTVAASLGVTAVLEPRPEATGTEATTLEADLNAFVQANPILFDQGAATLSASAAAIIDQIAARALAFGGIALTVEGHTDSDGDPNKNLALSQQRADTVRDALIERGLSAESITAIGYGSDQRVIVAGVEDKDASRRVAFQVEATT